MLMVGAIPTEHRVIEQKGLLNECKNTNFPTDNFIYSHYEKIITLIASSDLFGPQEG